MLTTDKTCPRCGYYRYPCPKCFWNAKISVWPIIASRGKLIREEIYRNVEGTPTASQSYHERFIQLIPSGYNKASWIRGYEYNPEKDSAKTFPFDGQDFSNLPAAYRWLDRC